MWLEKILSKSYSLARSCWSRLEQPYEKHWLKQSKETSNTVKHQMNGMCHNQSPIVLLIRNYIPESHHRSVRVLPLVGELIFSPVTTVISNRFQLGLLINKIRCKHETFSESPSLSQTLCDSSFRSLYLILFSFLGSMKCYILSEFLTSCRASLWISSCLPWIILE